MKTTPGFLTLLLFALSAPLAASPAAAQSGAPVGVDVTRDAALIGTLGEALSHPAVLLTLAGRNQAAGDVTQDEIDALDQQWRAETESEEQPLITAVLAGPLSGYLLQMQAGSLGLYSEIFVMDANGLNAGQSSITADYWQGDESKFQETYGKGKGTIFIDEPEFNAATRTWRQQVNMAITDENDELAGAVTIEINLNELARRRAVGLI